MSGQGYLPGSVSRDHPVQDPQGGEGSPLTPPCPAQAAGHPRGGVPGLTSPPWGPSCLLPSAAPRGPCVPSETVSILL